MRNLYLYFLFIILFNYCSDGQEDIITVRDTTSSIIENNNESSSEPTSQTSSPTTSETSLETVSPTTSETSTAASETTAENTTATISETSNITSENSDLNIETISSEDINYSIYEVQFVNENLGFAAVNNYLYKTSDGGENWSIAYNYIEANNINPSSNNNGEISEVLFISESIGFINLELSYNDGQLLKTLDGGNTFEKIFETDGSIIDMYLYNETLILQTDGFTSKIYKFDEEGDAEFYPSGVGKMVVYVSDDYGDSFKSFDFYQSNSNNNTGDGFCDTYSGFSIIVNDDVLFISSGGTNYHWVLRLNLNENDLENYVYNDDRELFVESGIMVAIPNIHIKTFFKIENYIYAFGNPYWYGSNDDYNGFVLTNDNGKSWTYKSFGKYEEITFFSSYFSTPNVGYIVGEAGHFLKTTDGGNNWEKIDLSTFKNIYDIEKIDDNTLILVGEDGFIFKYNM
tara:strand:+ start:7192 stop:8568 length:1377 start_codon:yes stop_codon:yes gene_type:complete